MATASEYCARLLDSMRRICERITVIQIGSFQVFEMSYGNIRLDGGAMFGAVPKTLWSKTNPSDELNRIDLKMRGLLVRKSADVSGPARNILIDCGIGSHWTPKFQEIFGVDFRQGSLETELKKHDLSPGEITDVILTHLHFDHAGGLTRLSDPSDPQSERVATFPNAKIYLQRRNWENALDPNEKERASYRRESFGIYDDTSGVAKNLKLLDSAKEEQLFQGISVEVSNGHTLGLQIIRIQDENRSLIYPADLIPTSSHIKPTYVAAYDCQPLLAITEKKKLLSRAVDENTIVVYEHCPFIAAGTIVRDVNGNFQHGKTESL